MSIWPEAVLKEIQETVNEARWQKHDVKYSIDLASENVVFSLGDKLFYCYPIVYSFPKGSSITRWTVCRGNQYLMAHSGMRLIDIIIPNPPCAWMWMPSQEKFQEMLKEYTE